MFDKASSGFAKQVQAAAPAAENNAQSNLAEHSQAAAQPREVGGRDGPEPTRFGDWEKGGRCIDF